MITRNLVLILGVVILVLIVGFVILQSGKEGEISSGEKELIEVWIVESNLNQYGDSKDTVYMGGTPLFNERTGESIDKYKYIIKNHSDRPWVKK